MKEKYLSGVRHPSEVFEDYLELDVFDKERFIEMLCNDEDSFNLLLLNSIVEEFIEGKIEDERITDELC